MKKTATSRSRGPTAGTAPTTKRTCPRPACRPGFLRVAGPGAGRTGGGTWLLLGADRAPRIVSAHRTAADGPRATPTITRWIDARAAGPRPAPVGPSRRPVGVAGRDPGLALRAATRRSRRLDRGQPSASSSRRCSSRTRHRPGAHAHLRPQGPALPGPATSAWCGRSTACGLARCWAGSRSARPVDRGLDPVAADRRPRQPRRLRPAGPKTVENAGGAGSCC